MVWLLVKIAFASIPALIIIAVIGLLIFLGLGAIGQMLHSLMQYAPKA
jgi:hypothetical protein